MVKKLVAALIFLVLIILVGTWLTPWTAEYEVKTAAKTACNEVIKTKKGYGDPKWTERFVRQSSTAGVKLKEGQFAFSAEILPNINKGRCHFKVAWKSVTPWLGVSDFFDDVPPLTMIHRLDAVHEIPLTF